ncbi:MAG: nucleotidyltransferase family protein [Dehalococcoidia bacterium]|nr:nucleotidyltransferase family protein [Dehalococcoidia bacterium]
MNRPVAIIPAAGASSRMGRPKPLLPWNAGTLLAYVLEQCRRAGFEERIVVVGAERAEVEAEARAGGAVIARNEGWQEGRASSIRAGADAAPETADPILVLSVDQPRPAWLLQQLLAAYAARPAEVLTPAHAGRRGHPALFAGALLPELRDVRDEDLGLRAMLVRHEAGIREIAVASALIHLDLNTPDAYERALREYRAGAWAAPIAAEEE